MADSSSTRHLHIEFKNVAVENKAKSRTEGRPIFEQQEQGYRERVLPPQVSARIAIEQASTFGWERYVGCAGAAIGMRSFGASAPIAELQKKFGFTADHVVAAARDQISKARG